MNRFFFTVNIFVGLILFCSARSYSQEIREGEITYISAKNIYVKIDDAGGVKIGDTLFIKDREKLIPAVKIEYLSSRSVAGAKIDKTEFKIGDKLYAIISLQEISTSKNDSLAERTSLLLREDAKKFTNKTSDKNLWKGRTSVQSISSYSNVNSDEKLHSTRATISLNYDDVHENNFEGNLYGSFVRNPSTSKKNNLKIYDLNAVYEFDSLSKLTAGRFINTNLSAAGNVDGISFERKISNYAAGIFIGSRPALMDYGYDFNLFQAGVFASRIDTFQNYNANTSLALINQTNKFKTDRRFLTLQHTNDLVPNSFLYFLSEVDLYENIFTSKGTTFRLSGLHATLRTNFSRAITTSISYDARKNIYYYESFKTYLDSNYSDLTRQTLRLGITLRLIDQLFINLNGSYGKRTGESKAANNFYMLVSYTDVPLIHSAVSVSINFINNIYSSSTISGVRVYRDFFNGLLTTSMNYRRVNYEFTFSSNTLTQNILSSDVAIMLPLGLYLSFNYEGIFQGVTTFNRLFIDLTKRF